MWPPVSTSSRAAGLAALRVPVFAASSRSCRGVPPVACSPPARTRIPVWKSYSRHPEPFCVHVPGHQRSTTANPQHRMSVRQVATTQMGKEMKAADLRAGDVYLHGTDPEYRQVMKWEIFQKGRAQIAWCIHYKIITGNNKGGGHYHKYREHEVVRKVEFQKKQYYFSYVDRENECMVVTNEDFDESSIPLKFCPERSLRWCETEIKAEEKITIIRDDVGTIIRVNFPNRCCK